MNVAAVRVQQLSEFDEPALDDLSDVLRDCVESGASVGFMRPLTRARARAFWQSVAICALAGERIVLVARGDAGSIDGTVQVVFAGPENQPHRADIAKMLVHRRARQRGVGAALLRAAESTAAQSGKTLLVLDTASDAAARLYAREGWQRAGVIPQFALWPSGGFCDTTFFYKQIRAGR